MWIWRVIMIDWHYFISNIISDQFMVAVFVVVIYDHHSHPNERDKSRSTHAKKSCIQVQLIIFTRLYSVFKILMQEEPWNELFIPLVELTVNLSFHVDCKVNFINYILFLFFYEDTVRKMFSTILNWHFLIGK